MKRSFALLACTLFACTDFTDITRGVCGNGLLEVGEDCDNEAASCVRCAVTCDAADDCPDGEYSCGNDGFCHAPGGQLAEPSAPVTFQADDLRVTDIDRDGAGDVIGVSKTSIIVRKGDAEGALSSLSSFVIPAQSGPPAFGDLDGDGSLDVTLATPDGIVTFTSRFGVLSPVAIEQPLFAEDGAVLNFLRLFPIGQLELGGLIEVNNVIQLVVITFLGPVPRIDAVAPCVDTRGVLDGDDLALSTFELYRVTAPDAFDREVLVSFATTGGRACVTSVHGNVLAGYTFDDISPTNATTTRPAILADVDPDADRCPGLIDSDAGAAALTQFDGVASGGHCTLANVRTNLAVAQNAPADARAIGRIELDPPIAGLGRDTLVLTSGVYVHLPVAAPPEFPQPTLIEMYSSNGRNLAFVATADLDNDGDTDAVLATSDQDDLDVLFRFPGGLQLLRIDTASQISALALGDFDGNGVRDIAYTETEGDHHDLMIAYGTADRPLDPIQVGTLSGVGSLTPIQFPDSVDTLGIVEDLAVIQPGAGTDGASLFSQLHGSPQRTMLSFFDPRTDDQRETTILRGAVIGDFVDDPPALHRDLVAIGSPRPGSSSGMRAWRVAGTPLGLDTVPTTGVAANGFADCTGSGVCVQNAEYLAFPIGAGHDVVLAVDREQPARAVLVDPASSGSGLERTEVSVVTQGVPAGAVVRSLHAADLDGDGRLEIIASFQAADAGEVRVCSIDAAGIPQACEDLTTVVAAAVPGVGPCIDAAPGALHDSTQPAPPGVDLVVLCRDGAQTSLFRVHKDGDYVVAALEAHAIGMTAIRLDDVTGDGLDDVIAMIGTGGSQSVIVFSQCSSRERGACQKATGVQP
jgi:hypothetical protein